MTRSRVVIIGAGVGGLAAAVGLAAQGCDVTVLERAATPGGKLREIEIDGRRIDVGPTVLTMRWAFEDIFAGAGEQLVDHLAIEPVDILARHYWPDGSTLDLHANETRSADAIAAFAGAHEANGFRRFCARSRQIFETLDHPFIRDDTPGMFRLARGVAKRRPADLLSISPFTTLWRDLGRYFKDQRLRQLFARYATYCGASPFFAPATLMLIAHVEQSGVWIVRDGMNAIAKSLAALAERRGAEFHYGAHVDTIDIVGGRATGVRLADGRRLTADAVLLNGDVNALASGHFGAAAQAAASPVARTDRSLSAITSALVADCGNFPLARHTVFFSSDYAREFADLDRGRRVPLEPTVYVCAQDRDGHGRLRAPGPERLFTIVNAPADGDAAPLQPEVIQQCETAMFQTLATCGLTFPARPSSMVTTTPTDFDRLFPATGGALYGRASHGWRASFQRPGARSRLSGLYLAGGSVHPGPGVPMAALSGQMAAARIIADLASTRRSSPAAMHGGTSTR